MLLIARQTSGHTKAARAGFRAGHQAKFRQRQNKWNNFLKPYLAETGLITDIRSETVNQRMAITSEQWVSLTREMITGPGIRPIIGKTIRINQS